MLLWQGKGARDGRRTTATSSWNVRRVTPSACAPFTSSSVTLPKQITFTMRALPSGLDFFAASSCATAHSNANALGQTQHTWEHGQRTVFSAAFSTNTVVMPVCPKM